MTKKISKKEKDFFKKKIKFNLKISKKAAKKLRKMDI